MSNAIVSFEFEGVQVQAVSRNGDAWFVGMEVADALGYADTDQAIRKHCKAAENLKPVELTGLGIDAKSPRGLKLIPERDLYRLVMNSQKPTAVAFEEKVVGEILPSIRQTGGYIAAAPQETSEELVLRAMSVLQATTERQKKEASVVIGRQQAQIDAAAPKVAALELISVKEGDLGIRDTGRELGIGQSRVREIILARRWACIQGRDIRPAHYGIEHGYVRMVARVYTDRITGQEKVTDDFKITRKGITRLAELVSSKG